MHVDSCLGSFVAIYAKEVGAKVPDYDFSVEGNFTIYLRKANLT